MNSSTSWFFSSRKYSVTASADKRHAQTGAGRFVHLAVDQRDLWSLLEDLSLVDDARLGHFVVEIVAFTGAFTDAGEHRDTAVQLGDVVDQFHDDDGLADAGATERADLAALQERADQIDDLDAGGKHLRRSGLIHKRAAPGDGSDSTCRP